MKINKIKNNNFKPRRNNPSKKKKPRRNKKERNAKHRRSGATLLKKIKLSQRLTF